MQGLRGEKQWAKPPLPEELARGQGDPVGLIPSVHSLFVPGLALLPGLSLHSLEHRDDRHDQRDL